MASVNVSQNEINEHDKSSYRMLQQNTDNAMIPERTIDKIANEGALNPTDKDQQKIKELTEEIQDKSKIHLAKDIYSLTALVYTQAVA